ncbi:MAG: dienelactone hydrolase family protein [Novosphingobium sp.]|nr:dienelactone hydrolase family protein [Novosphingobium sp.]
MCDETTAETHDRALAARGLTRREFAALGSAAALAACASNGTERPGEQELVEETVHITTGDGLADAFFVHPAKGKWPGVIMWPDIAGLREAKKIMARRLASAGYAVLVVNQYYRSQPAPVMESFSEFMDPEGRKKAMALYATVTPESVTRDAKAFVAFLDGKSAVDTSRGIGSNGYCMGGSFTIRSAASVPNRVKAAASFHGGGLVGDKPDSPINLLAKTQASFLIAIARDDDAKAPGDKDALRKAADAAGRPAEIEVYDGDHGWCVPDSPVYNPAEADRAFERMLALFKGL